MTFMIKFIDANIFIERWNLTIDFASTLNKDEYSTSVLVLSEVYHKLKQKKVQSAFNYLRFIMSSVQVFDVTQNDLFNAIKSSVDININDKLHIEVMLRNGINTIISYDKDFDKDKRIKREEL